MSNFDDPAQVKGLNPGEEILIRAEDVNGEDQVSLYVHDGEDFVLLFLGSEARHSLISALVRKSAVTAAVARREKEGWGVKQGISRK